MHSIALVDDGRHTAYLRHGLAWICKLQLLLSNLFQITHVLSRSDGQDDLGTMLVGVADGLKLSKLTDLI